jgi:hypothetical protein
MAFIYLAFELYDFPSADITPIVDAYNGLLADYAADAAFNAVWSKISDSGIEAITDAYTSWVPPINGDVTINGFLYPSSGPDPHNPFCACAIFSNPATYVQDISDGPGWVARVLFRSGSAPPMPSSSPVMAPRPATIPIGGNLKNSLPCERQIRLGM